MIEVVDLSQRNITQSHHVEEKAQQSLRAAQSLSRLTARLEDRLSLGAVLDILCDETSRLLKADLVSISLQGTERRLLFINGRNGSSPRYITRPVGLPKTFYDEVVRHRIPLILHDDKRYAEYNVFTILATSILLGNDLVGVLSVGYPAQGWTFDETEFTLLQGIANQAAQAIVNAQLLEKTHRCWLP